MRSKTIILAFIASLLALLAVDSQAQDKVADENTTLSDFTFGKAILGEDPTEDNLDGKVVMIEFWGVR